MTDILTSAGIDEASLVNAMARRMCAANGTSQCAAICLSFSAQFNRNGQCSEATRVHKQAARGALSGMLPYIAALVNNRARRRMMPRKQAPAIHPTALMAALERQVNAVTMLISAVETTLELSDLQSALRDPLLTKLRECREAFFPEEHE